MSETFYPIKDLKPIGIFELIPDGQLKPRKKHASSGHEFAGFKGALQNPPARQTSASCRKAILIRRDSLDDAISDFLVWSTSHVIGKSYFPYR